VLWLALPSGAREVRFVMTKRQNLISTVQTNGKAEPIEWLAVRAGRDGTIAGVEVERGQQVRNGDIIAELESDTARANLATAQARMDQAKALLALYQDGGPPAEIAEIELGLANARLEVEAAGEEAASLERLAAEQAATRQEVMRAQERVRRAEVEIAALEKTRQAIVLPSERREAEAALRAAEAETEEWARRLSHSTVRAPMDGVVYNLAVRQGSYVQPGDLLADVGRLDQLRLTIYVDEPELKSVREGMPVVITWDALPERRWEGVVERLPTQIVPLGTRQVGEVSGIIDNPGLDLPVSANINAQLHSEVSASALSIPKEALRRQGDELGIWTLEGEAVTWRALKLGAANITHVEVLSGLSENDPVALPAEPPLAEGERVTPLFE